MKNRKQSQKLTERTGGCEKQNEGERESERASSNLSVLFEL